MTSKILVKQPQFRWIGPTWPIGKQKKKRDIYTATVPPNPPKTIGTTRKFVPRSAQLQLVTSISWAKDNANLL